MKTMLEMKEITKSFGKGQTAVQALKSVSIQVNEGEFVSVIGPSGSGKSTFLTIAGALQSPTSGQMIINGHDFAKLSEKKRAQMRFDEIGFILQSANLVPFLTVQQQFELTDKVKQQKLATPKVEALLKALDIWAIKDKLPRDLSGGQKQRVAIARALYNEPHLILADEPTASLDTPHAYEVVELLKKQAKQQNKATIMVTHDERMIAGSDRVYRMEDGQLTLDSIK